MDIRTVHAPTPDAMMVRQTVFVEEQGFVDDPDEIDPVAAHLIVYDNDAPVAVCRLFPHKDSTYMLGRFAVLSPYRKRGVGSELLLAAENYARAQGASHLALHSQWHAKGFYEKHGYIPQGDIEYEQGHAHVFMQKKL